jgi:hypothetical protein
MKRILIGSLLFVAVVLVSTYLMMPSGKTSWVTSPGRYMCKIKVGTVHWEIKNDALIQYCPKDDCECAEAFCTDSCTGDICSYWPDGWYEKVDNSVCNNPELMPHCDGTVCCPAGCY